MKNKLLIIFLMCFLFVIYWRLWGIGVRVATDFPSLSDNYLKSFLDYPRAWNDYTTSGLGMYMVFTLWAWPLNYITGIFANLGLNFYLQEKILYFLPFLFLGSMGVWMLGREMKLSSGAKFISTLFYLTNTYIILVIDGGQLRIALAYAWFPFSFLAIEKAINGQINRLIWVGIVVSILGFLDIRFIFVLFFLSLIRFFYGFFFNLTNLLSWVISWLRLGTVVGLIVLGFNLYWLIPLLVTPENDIYGGLTQTSFLSFSTLGHSLLLLSPHWHKNVFGQVTPLLWEFIFIPILVFSAAILTPRNFWVGFWLLVSLVSVFLTKGAIEPFASFYPWLFSHIPGFSLFRDSTKFFCLVALSYSYLLGITIDEIIKRIDKFPKIKLVFFSAVICYLVFLIRPVWLGQMTGVFSDPSFQSEYSNLGEYLANDHQFSRIFWIPTIAPLGEIDLAHPVVQAADLVQERPFALGTKGAYEIFNFLREGSFIGQIFDIAGIGYIAYPYPDLTRYTLKPDNVEYYYLFLDQLSNLPWLSKVDNSSIPLLKVKEHQDKFFVPNSTWWVIGSDGIYIDATKSAQLKLSKNAFIFAEQHLNLASRIDEFTDSKIILYNKTMIDLAASFIGGDSLIFPADNLNYDPNQTGWWKRVGSDLINWRYFLQTKYDLDNIDFDLGGGWAVAEGNLTLQLSTDPLVGSNQILLARVMTSSNGGRIDFYQGDKQVGSIKTKTEQRSSDTYNSESEKANFSWFEVGIMSNKPLTIKVTGKINVVNAIAFLSVEQWQSLKDKAEQLQATGRVFKWEDVATGANVKPLQQNLAEVNYKKISPTEYKIKLINVNGPTTIAFSQRYDKYWKIDNQSPVPLYSLINGFLVPGEGEYVVKFTPQKYLDYGFIISMLFLVAIIFVLLGKRFRSIIFK